jgi:hypothetical protein
VERYLGWLLVAARLLVAIVFLLNGFGIVALAFVLVHYRLQMRLLGANERNLNQ